MKRVLLTAISVVLAFTLSAQVPQAFKYQTVVRDNTGEILDNQDVYFRISILQGSSSGTEVYKETFSLTTNDYGLASFNIGQGTVESGTFATISWSSDEFWVKIELDPDASGIAVYEEVGTSQLLSVPYSFSAKSATSADNAYWTKNVNDIYFSGGRVGIGTNAPSSPLYIKGTHQWGTVTVEESTDSHTDVHESALNITNQSNIAGSQANIMFSAGNPGHGRAIISGTHDISAGTYNGNLTFKIRNGNTSYISALTIRSSGNIGINETNPMEKLHVNGNAYITGNLLVNGSTSGNLNLLSPANLAGNGVITSVTVDANASGFGAALYLASDGNYEEADADAAATMPCVALALETGTGTKNVLLQGYIRNDSWAWTPGGLIYISPVTGALTQTIPSTTGQQVQITGYATSPTIVYFNPNLMLIEIK